MSRSSDSRPPTGWAGRSRSGAVAEAEGLSHSPLRHPHPASEPHTCRHHSSPYTPRVPYNIVQYIIWRRVRSRQYWRSYKLTLPSVVLRVFFYRFSTEWSLSLLDMIGTVVRLPLQLLPREAAWAQPHGSQTLRDGKKWGENHIIVIHTCVCSGIDGFTDLCPRLSFHLDCDTVCSVLLQALNSVVGGVDTTTTGPLFRVINSCPHNLWTGHLATGHTPGEGDGGGCYGAHIHL